MEEIQIRECTTIEEFDSCVALQSEAFGLPDLEISPRRHLIVSRQAGGWTLAAFTADRMIGFVHHLAAVRPNNEVYGYSHMMAVAARADTQGWQIATTCARGPSTSRNVIRCSVKSSRAGCD